MLLDPTWTPLTITGQHIQSFLNGIFSNSLAQKANYGAFLNTKGRIVTDAFVIIHTQEECWIVTPTTRVPSLMDHIHHLGMFSDITLTKTHHHVYRALQSVAKPRNLTFSFADPRLPELGFWGIAPPQEEIAPPKKPMAIHQARLQHGIAEGDNIPENRGIILQYNFQNIHGVSFTKGCYVGQELIARTYHRGEIRKIITPITVEGTLEPGTKLLDKNGNEAGHIVETIPPYGIALCPYEALNSTLASEYGPSVICHHPIGTHQL